MTYMNWIFENNINTDLITPGRYNITTDAHELAKITFIEYRPEFTENVKEGDFIIAGNNFGCGSSRETAVTALKTCGIKAIIAKSFARIFYRNCINAGLYAITANTALISERDEIMINIKKKVIINKTRKISIAAEISPLMEKIHQYGGIIPFLKIKGLAEFKKIIT